MGPNGTLRCGRGEKCCGAEGAWQPVDNFKLLKTGKRDWWCRLCRKEYSREHKQRQRDETQQRDQRNKDKLAEFMQPLGHEKDVRLTILAGDRVITVVGKALVVQSRMARWGNKGRQQLAGLLAAQGRIVIDTDIVVAKNILLDLGEQDSSGQVRWLRDKLRYAALDPFDFTSIEEPVIKVEVEK